MAFVVVLDACVLYPFSLRDTLLRFAEAEAYAVRWSERILDEVLRNLIGRGIMDRARADWLGCQLREAFEDAVVPEDAITSLEGAMGNHAGDRHVLAAAVATNAAVIVTANLRHFEACHLEQHGVEAQHPDEFLVNLFGLSPALAVRIVRGQARDLLLEGEDLENRFESLLELLVRAGVPDFVAALRGAGEPTAAVSAEAD